MPWRFPNNFNPLGWQILKYYSLKKCVAYIWVNGNFTCILPRLYEKIFWWHSMDWIRHTSYEGVSTFSSFLEMHLNHCFFGSFYLYFIADIWKNIFMSLGGLMTSDELSRCKHIFQISKKCTHRFWNISLLAKKIIFTRNFFISSLSI